MLQVKAQELLDESTKGPSEARAAEMVLEFQIVGAVNETYGPTYPWSCAQGVTKKVFKKSRLVPNPSCRLTYLPAHEVTRKNLDALIAWCHANKAGSCRVRSSTLSRSGLTNPVDGICYTALSAQRMVKCDKTAKERRATPFVAQLKRMIEERPDIIRWRRGAIMIPDPAALERNLSKYYKHSKYASFQRQLNNFGYRRRFDSGGDAAETVYERVGASENLDDLLALRPVRPAKRGRDEPPASPARARVRVAAAPPAAFDAAASLLALGAS